jgi:uncharacterized protein YjeT (DUF2065 family)
VSHDYDDVPGVTLVFIVEFMYIIVATWKRVEVAVEKLPQSQLKIGGVFPPVMIHDTVDPGQRGQWNGQDPMDYGTVSIQTGRCPGRPVDVVSRSTHGRCGVDPWTCPG